MHPLGYDIPQLTSGSITGSDLNQIQVCTEISRQFIDEETLVGRGLLISTSHPTRIGLLTLISVEEKARVAVLSLG